MAHISNNNKNAFTLIELSITLVIIGLIVGGVLVGQELIQQAKYRQQISQFQRYDAAASTFRLKYNGLPGDLKNAVALGLDRDSAGTINTCWVVTSISRDGNGNKLLEDNNRDDIVTYTAEIANFYVHLSNAGLIEQQIVGHDTGACSAANALDAGTHFPKAPIGEGLFTVYADGALHHVLGGSRAKGKHYYLSYPAWNFHNQYGLSESQMTPSEAFAIDSKLDDGKPSSGQVNAIKAHQILSKFVGDSSSIDYGYFVLDDDDASNECVYNSEYNVSNNTDLCSITIRSSAG